MKTRIYPIKVLLVDDHVLFLEGIAEIFAAEDDMRVIGQAQNGLEAVALAETQKPDVVLLDVEMPLMGAEEAIGEILRASPSSKVLVLSMYDEPRLVRKLLALGAHAFLTKNASRGELLAAVHTVHRDEDRVVLSGALASLGVHESFSSLAGSSVAAVGIEQTRTQQEMHSKQRRVFG